MKTVATWFSVASFWQRNVANVKPDLNFRVHLLVSTDDGSYLEVECYMFHLENFPTATHYRLAPGFPRKPIGEMDVAVPT